MRTFIKICMMFVFLCTSYATADWTTINMPGSDITGTYPRGVDGNNVVGFYMTTASIYYDHAFLYENTAGTWTSYDAHYDSSNNITSDGSGSSAIDTIFTGISGDKIVGAWQDASGITHGLIYNQKESSWTTLDISGNMTTPLGIDGNNVVGIYGSAGTAFVYDLSGGILTEFNNDTSNLGLGVYGIIPRGISGNSVVGKYMNNSGQHGFVYDLESTTWTILDSPDATPGSTDIWDVSGSLAVGGYTDKVDGNGYGFVKDLTDIADLTEKTWAKLDAGEGLTPGTDVTIAYGISGDKVVGTFADPEGFLYIIPEPSTLALFMSGIAHLTYLWRCRKRMKK